jgi:hypothetical protein
LAEHVLTRPLAAGAGCGRLLDARSVREALLLPINLVPNFSSIGQLEVIHAHYKSYNPRRQRTLAAATDFAYTGILLSGSASLR